MASTTEATVGTDEAYYVYGIVPAETDVTALEGGRILEAVALTKFAHEAGANAFLHVAPYYNKPSQEGVYRHFAAIAESTDRTIVLYSIPGRCGIQIVKRGCIAVDRALVHRAVPCLFGQVRHHRCDELNQGAYRRAADGRRFGLLDRAGDQVDDHMLFQKCQVRRVPRGLDQCRGDFPPGRVPRNCASGCSTSPAAAPSTSRTSATRRRSRC